MPPRELDQWMQKRTNILVGLMEKLLISSTTFRLNLAGPPSEMGGPFSLVELDCMLLQTLHLAYPEMLPPGRFVRLQQRIQGASGYHVFGVRADTAWVGLFELAMHPFKDPNVLAANSVREYGAHLFGDTPFPGPDAPAVLAFAIKGRLQKARLSGCDHATVSLRAGQGEMMRLYRSEGFLPSERTTTLDLGFKRLTMTGGLEEWKGWSRRLTRRLVTGAIAHGLLWSGSVRRCLARGGNHIHCVYFHNPDRALFEGCVRWLKQNQFTFLSSKDLLTILEGGGGLPEGKLVHLSLDDGWLSNLSEVVPVARIHNVPITIFITTQAVLDGDYWWSYARYGSRNPEDYKAIPESIRKAWTREERSRFRPEREAMRPCDVVALSRVPEVTLGCHTAEHAIPSQCTDIELRQELERATEQLREWTGEEPLFYSYPNGDEDPRQLPILHELGYRMAFNTQAKVLTLKSAGAMKIPRFCAVEGATLSENICRMVGLWQNLFSR